MKQKILLDQHFENILRNKLILAYIMKDNLDEYANSSIGEIMKCIEPQGDVPLHTHLISGHRNENNEDDVSDADVGIYPPLKKGGGLYTYRCGTFVLFITGVLRRPEYRINTIKSSHLFYIKC